MNANNSKLLDLINTYYKKEGKGDSYMNVIQELINGNSVLLLPSENDTPENQKSDTEGENKTLKLSSVATIDGIHVLGAFTDEDALQNWAKKPMPYKMLASKDVLKICEQNSIQRIVINSGSPNIFVLQQSKK